MLGSVTRKGQQIRQASHVVNVCYAQCPALWPRQARVRAGTPPTRQRRSEEAAAMVTGQGPVTITDVARLAGVSPGTASKALNGRRGISARTAIRVQQAAERLGYQPNALARGLLSGRSFTVGLITTDSFGRFSIPVVDGIIVTGRRQDRREPIGRDLRVPVVYAMAYSSDPADFSLVPDDEDGGALAIRHLLSTGRTSIGHITGPRRFQAAVLRAAGAEQALAAAGLHLAGGRPLYGEWTEEWGRGGVDLLLGSAPGLDAIFCGNDQIARGAADRLRELGRRVPADVALVGFDNWEVIATACRPPLTTVDMNLRQLGRAAGERLLAAVDGQPASGLQLLPCRLVIRDSTRPRDAVLRDHGQ